MTFPYYYNNNNKKKPNHPHPTSTPSTSTSQSERLSPTLLVVGDKRFLGIALLASTLSLLWLQYNNATCSTIFGGIHQATAANQMMDQPRIASVPTTSTSTSTSIQRRTINNLHELTDLQPFTVASKKKNTNTNTTSSSLTTTTKNNKKKRQQQQQQQQQLPHRENNRFPPGVSRLVVLVQGPLNNLDEWCDRIEEQGDSDTFLIYGVFDQEPPTWFNAYHRDRCQVIYIPNTTWTQGRNELSKAAYCYEQQRNKNFMYWIFSDDDIMFRSSGCTKKNCWRRYLDWIKYTMPSIRTPLLVGYFAPPLVPYCLTDFYDAALNAMDRKQIHLLLPYITKEPKGTSWWLSALVQIQVGRACFPMAAMAYELAIKNPVHRDYPRGLEWEDGAALVVNNYHDYVPSIPIPRGNETRDIRHIQLLDKERLLQYVAEQMEKVGDTCEPLKRRWQDWLTSWGSTNCTRFEVSNVTIEESEDAEEEEEDEEEEEEEEEEGEEEDEEEEEEESEEEEGAEEEEEEEEAEEGAAVEEE